MSEFKRYWDDELRIGVAVKCRKIDNFFYKKPFNSDCETVTYTYPKTLYGSYGCAYHSGNKGVHIADYMGAQHIVDVSGKMEVTIATNYSICDDICPYDEFYQKNMLSFYTSDKDIMPLMGYVALKEKFEEPFHSIYEMRNNIEVTDKAIECDPNLNGDCLGQMAIGLCMGMTIHNCICKTPFKTMFYDRVISCSPINNAIDETILIRSKEVKPVIPCSFDLASKYRVPAKDISLDRYGSSMVHLIRDDEIAEINTIGYITKFSGGKFDCLYSYSVSENVKIDAVAGWNAIVRKD